MARAAHALRALWSPGSGTCTGPRWAPWRQTSKPMPSRPVRTSAIRTSASARGAVGERADRRAPGAAATSSSAQTTRGPVVASRKRAKAAWRFSTEPWYSRWSGSTLVTMAPAWGMAKPEPSLSSASTTNQSPSVHAAPWPRSETRPPTMKDGSRPPSCSTRASMADVVVLPWVPATARVRRWAAMAASRTVRRTTGMPRRRASTTSGLSSGTAVEMATSSTSAGTLAGVVADGDGDAQSPAAGRAPRSPADRCPTPDGPWPPAPWRWATSRCHRSPPRGPTRGVDRERQSGPTPSETAGSGTGAWRSTRSATRSAASGRARAWAAAPMAARRSGWSSRGWSSRTTALAVELAVGDQDGRAGPHQGAGVGGLVIPRGDRQRHEQPGQAHLGQLGDGGAPGPTDQQIGGGEQQVHVVLVADHLVEQAARRAAPGPPRPWRRSRGSRSRGGSRDRARSAHDRHRRPHRLVDLPGTERPGDHGDDHADRSADRAPPRAGSRSAARSMASTSARTGLPVTTGGAGRSRRTAPRRPWRRQPASRLAAPARAFCSATTIGTRHSTAPITQATLA